MRIRLREVSRCAMVLVVSAMLVLGNSFYHPRGASADSALLPVTGIVTGPNGERLEANVIVSAVSDTTGQTFNGESAYGYNRPDYLGYGEDYADPSAPYFVGTHPGAYELDLPADTYDIHFDNASTSAPWASSVVSNVVVSGPTTVNGTLMPTVATHTLSGTVTDANNNPIPNAWVQAGAVGPFVAVQTDANGQYSMTLPPYQYGWNISAYDFTNTASNLPQQFSQLNAPSSSDMTSDVAMSIQTPPTTVISVLVKDKSGNPDRGQTVTTDGGSPSLINSLVTDANGIANVTVWQADNVEACAFFKSDNLKTCSQIDTNNSTAELDESNGTPLVVAVASPTASTNPSPTNKSVTFSDSFTDPNDGIAQQPHTVSWNWGDGSGVTTQTVNGGDANQTVHFSSTHTYTQSGTYMVTVTATDAHGGTTSSTMQMMVYDKTERFIGLGKYLSSPGSVTAQPHKNGPTTYRVRAKYVKGVLKASASMDFKKASVAFASTSCQSLAISGQTGRLSCTGTVNGIAGYAMLVTATDNNSTGLVRIKIVDSANAVVYDSQPGDPDTANPTTTAMSGGVAIIQ